MRNNHSSKFALIVMIFGFLLTSGLMAQHIFGQRPELGSSGILTDTAIIDTLWTKSFGGNVIDKAYCVQQTTDSGYILGGFTSSFGHGGFDIYLVRTNSFGDTLWTKTIGGTNNDYANWLEITNDQGYIIVGYTNSFGNGSYDVYLVKTNANGDTLWTKTYGTTNDERGYCVQPTNDGGYILSATKRNGSYDAIWLIKTNANGDTLWTKTIGGGGYNDYAYFIRQTSDHGFILTGDTRSWGPIGSSNVLLLKCDSIGQPRWARGIGGSSADVGYCVRQTPDNGYMITGYTLSFGQGLEDVYLIKTNSTGDTLWTKTFGGQYSERGRSISIVSDGGYIITGNTMSFGHADGYSDVYIIKTDSLGNQEWYRTYGTPLMSDEGFCVQPTFDNGYVVAGYTYGLGDDAWLLKLGDTNPSGIGFRELNPPQPAPEHPRIPIWPPPPGTIPKWWHGHWPGHWPPIPAKSDLFQDVQLSKPLVMQVFDLNGKLIYTTADTHPQLRTNGIYFYRLLYQNYPFGNGKIVIVK